MSSVAITLCVASQRVFIVAIYFVMTQSGNFWIHPRTPRSCTACPEDWWCQSNRIEIG